jgi:succinate dehydrogenase / fumarate reductase flavoprotein subunit
MTTFPDNYKSQTSTDPEEGWRYTQNDKNAKRPPELLTRDHVARCINREVKAGRGSPHGGVFLDISWIKEKIPNAAEHIKRKLPSMYHQFMQLANLDITKEPMEIGPTTHYAMGGIRVNGDTQATNVPGLVRGGRMRRRSARREPARRQFAFRPHRLRQTRRRIRREIREGKFRRQINDAQVEAAYREAVEPFERPAGGGTEGPYQVQYDLQNMMQERRHRALAERNGIRARRHREAQGARGESRRAGPSRIQPRLAHGD